MSNDRMILEFFRRLGGLLQRSRSDADLEKELRVHLSIAAEEEQRRGHAPQDAGRRARVRAGSVAATMDALRDQRSLPWLDSLRSDLVFGWRQIVRHRVASGSAILSLGLVIGAMLAAFRLVDAVLLRPLPVADPARLFVLTKTFLDNDQRPDDRDDFDYRTYRRYVAIAGETADLMILGMAAPRSIVIDGEEPEIVVQQFVSGNVFSTLGVRPAVGRLLGAQDDVVPGGHPVVAITYDYWQRRFGGDPAVVGRTLRIGGRVHEIVGVTARGFTGTEPGAITNLFVPAMMNATALNNEGWTWFRIWLRPKTGIDAAQVGALLQAAYKAEQAERAKGFPQDAPRWRIDAFLNEQLLLQPAGSGASGLQKAFRKPLWILAGLAALLVLIACANVANLLLARAASRRIEMALRLSIGAAGRRLVQLMLVESALLGLLASLVGALFAWWAAPLIVSMLAPANRPVRLVLDLDWRTCGAAVALTLVVTAIFGLVPALRASATTPIDALRETRGGVSHRRMAGLLVGAQTAVCVFLLFGASLFAGTFQRLQHRPLGFSTENLLHVPVEVRVTRPAEEWAQLAASMRELPGVEAATVVSWAPLTGNRWRSAVTVPGGPSPETSPHWVSVSRGYFATMQTPMRDGRDFRAGDRGPGRDDTGRPVPGVAIVNETFARTYFGGRSPVGQRVLARSFDAPMEIVGLTGDAVYFSVREANQPTVFVPLEDRYGATLLLRTSPTVADLRPVLRAELSRLRPGLQVRDVAPFQSFVTQQTLRERLLATLSMFFAALALALAVIGMYGVLNYAVTREQWQIGLRMALGARPAQVALLVMTPLMAAVSFGALVGTGAGVAFGRIVHSLLFEISPTHPSALALPLVILLGATIVAVVPPTLRAARIDPAHTIRREH